MHLRSIFATAALAGLFPPAAEASSNADLLQLINAYRAQPAHCQGSTGKPSLSLASEPKLIELNLENERPLQEALRNSGYPAARAEVMTLSGPSDTQAAFQFAKKLNCRLLLNPDYTVAGISRQGNVWQIVLAMPLIPTNIGHWQDAGRKVLKLVNAARASGRSCGKDHYEMARPLQWSNVLALAALVHSRDMAENTYFSHESRHGRTVGDRAKEQSYSWRIVGENIATGQALPEQVVDSWLASPGHCANIMRQEFTEMGAAYAINPKSSTVIYWTQVFGTPQ